MEYLKIADSPVMWAAVIPAVALVFVQAFLFTKKAVKDGTKMGISKEQFKNAAKASFAASIGPSLVIVIGMVSLLVAIGGPMAWMRLAYIGSVGFELMAADFGATAAGAELGGAGMTGNVFAVCCWVMCISCLGWIIVTALFTDKMDVMAKKITFGNSKKMAVISAGGCIGAYSYLTFDKCMPAASPQVIAIITAFAVQGAISFYGKKTKAPWTAKWGMTIAMFSGMIGGALFM